MDQIFSKNDKIFFLRNFGLKKNFSKIQFFFYLKRMTKDSTFISQTDGPIHTPIWHIWLISILRNFEKNFFFKKISKLWVCAVWVHILGVSERAQKLQYMVYNIFRSHQNPSSRTKVMKNQKLGPIQLYLVPIFTFVGFSLCGHFGPKSHRGRFGSRAHYG